MNARKKTWKCTKCGLSPREHAINVPNGKKPHGFAASN